MGDLWPCHPRRVSGLSMVGLFPAIAPAAVTVYLHNMTDYVAPWREEPIGPTSFSDEPVLYVMFVIGGILLEAAFLSVGLLLRAAWEWVRSGDRRSSSPDSS